MRPLELTVRDFAEANARAKRLKHSFTSELCEYPARNREPNAKRYFIECWETDKEPDSWCEACRRRQRLYDEWRSVRARRGSLLSVLVKRGNAMLLGDEG